MATGCHVRSISLPSRSHPTTLKIQRQLNKLRSWERSSGSMAPDMMCTGLTGLEELQKSLDELLRLPSTQHVLSHSHYLNEKWVDDILDGSVRLLDVCGSTRDVTSHFKENARELQSALRRRKGDVCMGSSIRDYLRSRKKITKDAKKLVTAVKKMNRKTGASPPLDQDDCHLSVVVGEVNAMAISIFQALLLLLIRPVAKPKPRRWSLVSKFVHWGVAKHENIEGLEGVDLISSGRSADLKKIKFGLEELETLGASMEGLENGLECTFRRLINTSFSPEHNFSVG